MIRDLAPLLGRRLSFAWSPTGTASGHWRRIPTTAGWFGRAPRSFSFTATSINGSEAGDRPRCSTERSDEMNGLDPDETRRTLERGQRVFTEVFGEPARGFLAPAWQRGTRAPERTGMLLGTGPRPGLLLPRVTGGPKGSPGDVDLGLWPLGLARAHRAWDRVAASVAGSWSPYPGDSSQRSGAGFLAEDPPAHPGAPRGRVRTEHTGGVARGE